MKKIKLSSAEKRLMRFYILCIIGKLLIIQLFLTALIGLRPIKLEDTKQIDIVVEDIYIDRFRSQRMVLFSDSEAYIINNRSSKDEYSISQLEELIFIGSELSLNYCEERYIWGEKYNLIVNAQTEEEVYRSINSFNENSKNGSQTLLIILIISDLFFCFGIILHTIDNKNIIKQLFKKYRKQRHI